MKLKNCFLIALLACLVLGILLFFGFFSNIQMKLADNLYGGKQALNSIIIIGIDDKSLQELGRWPWSRERFADIIPQLNEAKVIGIDITFSEVSNKDNDSAFGNAIRDSKVPIVLSEEYINFLVNNKKIIGKNLLVPIPELSDAKRGYANIITDSDGVTRAINLDLSKEEKAFSLVIYENYWGPAITPKINRFLINFVGKPGSFKYYSFSDVLNKSFDKSLFKNKIILIGATSPDLRDTAFVPTSNGKAMSGIEIHANILQTLINKDYIKEQSKPLVFLLILIFGLIIGLMFYKFKLVWPSLALPFMIIGYLFLAIKLFDYGIIANIVYIPLAIVFVYFSEVGYKYVLEKKGKQEIKNAFSKYVSDKVVNEILRDPSKLKLGGDKKNITVFFSDIRGFTSFSEKLSPEKLVHVLNEYLTAMTNIVLRNEGVVDKYIGDAIMAFWGAPIKIKNHAELACNTAVEMIKELRILKEKWKKQNFPEINIGIGLNTGDAVIGNMGSYERFDYTAMGDTINLGSRLESLTKFYGVNILISETTQKDIEKSGNFIVRKLDYIKVKGKNEPIVIFELIGKTREIDKKLEEAAKKYEEAFELYKNQKFKQAKSAFSKMQDKASQEMAIRCAFFEKSKNRPKKDWDGSWKFETK